MSFNKTLSDISDVDNISEFLASYQETDAFFKTMFKNNTLDFIDFLLENKRILKEDYETIKAMITSTDEDNFIVAVCIIKEKNYFKN